MAHHSVSFSLTLRVAVAAAPDEDGVSRRAREAVEEVAAQ
jgi:hypothetical protein